MKPIKEQIESWYSNHLYIGGIHWLARCPLCVALMAKADAVVAEPAEHTE